MRALTFITPVSPDHQKYLPVCIASVKEQTIPCEHLLMLDENRQGPGIIRNRLLKQATTDYVTFLDADDWLEPDFAAKMLPAAKLASYAYCSWYQDGEVKPAPELAWCNGTFHLITSVIPRQLAVMVGGFDENLPALEDTDFFLKFVSRRWCGKRVAEPLVHYRAHGGRSDEIHRDANRLEAVRIEISRRYGGIALACCGGESVVDNTPIGVQQEGDVLAMALWGGNRAEHGRATGRRYIRISWPKTTWVDPRDVAAAPHMWKMVSAEEAAPPAPFELTPLPAPRGIHQLAAALTKLGYEAPRESTMLAAEVALPNFRKVRRLAGAVDWPVFVAPRRIYPSYADFWKLVDLGGFELSYADEIDLVDPNKTYIFSGPEAIPNCSQAKARTIFWQLEYVGDYINQENIQTVSELWSSDPEHAVSCGARYVTLGSHRGLNPRPDEAVEPKWDLSMLAYLTPRRMDIKNQLADYQWAPDYPGHGTSFRHDVLRSTRLMLHVHQHDAPAMTPLRYALAAAYKLPLISERVANTKPYKKAVIWESYERLANRAERLLGSDLHESGNALHDLLCVQFPFEKCVMDAIQ